ncbi:MAG TPA: hypothetical protein DDW50_08180 [Firmicutes bacterium]|nr:hypothetical protein [Bacillota bacterium]
MTEHDEIKKQKAREARGKITPDFVRQFRTLSDQDLVALFQDNDSRLRTAAAQIFGQRKAVMAIPDLCRQFAEEKALYTRIALSDALSQIGAAAIPELIPYIGEVGSSQHADLPSTIFKKWSYPLPRDLVIRCIIRMGIPALAELNSYLFNRDETLIREVIDGIGHISFYCHDQSSLNNVLKIVTQYPDHPVIVWKVIRALQAFSDQEALQVLQHFLLESGIPQHRWEAARSLGQIATENATECLTMAQSDVDPRVRAMVGLALTHVASTRN